MATPGMAQDDPKPSTQHALSPENGATSDGAVQDIATNDNDNISSQTSSRDAIREGKEKAKAIMAASGVNVASESGEHSPARARRDSSEEPGASGASGVASSRKRSRSGSRLINQPTQPTSTNVDQPAIQEFLLQQYIERDSLHAAAMNDQAEASRNRMTYKLAERNYYMDLRQRRHMDPGSIYGYGYLGYGNGLTDQKMPSIVYPEKKKRPGTRRSRTVHISRKDKEQQAEQLEELVPVRLDVEFDKIKLRDTFTWNLHDRVTNPEVFAENLVEDFKVPPEAATPVAQIVTREIRDQIQDFYPHVYIEEEALDPQLPYSAYKNDEMRILIQLHITIGHYTLVDKFEWELNNPLNSPEEFASLTAKEMSLSGEFATAIAHCIREQCQTYTKSLYITGHPFDGRPVEDADVRDSLLPSPLPAVFRYAHLAKDYAPLLYEVGANELEAQEDSLQREQRRQKRSVNRRGGPALPDLKERQRTVRTLVVSSVLPGAAETLEDSRLYKFVRSSGRGRRAAGRVDRGDDSDESEESDSGAESVAPSQMVTGTSRTRNMRGAASAAQAAMRANLGRSATPEVAALHHHETRTSSRRSGVQDREESVFESLIVKLRVPKEKLRQLLLGNRVKAPAGLSTPLMAQKTTSQRSTPTASSMLPPPSPAPQQSSNPVAASPRSQPSNLPTQSQQPWQYASDGRTEAPYPLPQGFTPPPPPPWLANALRSLQENYPRDEFEALMRYSAVDKASLKGVRVEPGQPLPANVKYQYLPRIRCNDCPGKLYTAGPELTVDNFEVHLKNRQHRTKVDERRRRNGS